MLSESIFETSDGEKLAEFLRKRRGRKTSQNIFPKQQADKENSYSFNIEFESSDEDVPRARESDQPTVQNKDENHDKVHKNNGSTANNTSNFPKNTSVNRGVPIVVLENVFAKPSKPARVRKSLFKNSTKTSFLPAASSTPRPKDDQSKEQNVAESSNTNNPTKRNDGFSGSPMVVISAYGLQCSSSWDRIPNIDETVSSRPHRNSEVATSQNGPTVSDKDVPETDNNGIFDELRSNVQPIENNNGERSDKDVPETENNRIFDALRNDVQPIERSNIGAASSNANLAGLITSDEGPTESIIAQPAPAIEPAQKDIPSVRATRSSASKKSSRLSVVTSVRDAVPDILELRKTPNIVPISRKKTKSKGRKKTSNADLKQEYLEITKRLSQNHFSHRKSESRRKLYSKNHSGEDEHKENSKKTKTKAKNFSQTKNVSTVKNTPRLSVRTDLMDADLITPVTKTTIVKNISNNLKTINKSLSREETSSSSSSSPPESDVDIDEINRILSPVSVPENESSGEENLHFAKKSKEKQNKNIKEKKEKRTAKLTKPNRVDNEEGVRRSSRKRRFPRAYWTNDDVETDGIPIFCPGQEKPRINPLANKTKNKKENNPKYTKKRKVPDDIPEIDEIPEQFASEKIHSPHKSANNIAVKAKKKLVPPPTKTRTVATHSTQTASKDNTSQGTQTEADDGKSKIQASWLNKFLEPNVSEIPVELMGTDEPNIGRCNALSFEKIGAIVYAYYAGKSEVNCGYMKFEENSRKAKACSSSRMELLIMFGCLEVIINNLKHIVNAGDFIYISKGEFYTVENKSGQVALIYYTKR